MTIPHVQATAYPALNRLVESHLTSLIGEAVEVQRHCKRARIHLPKETNSNKQPSPRRRIHAEDINMALQWRGSEKIYATATVGSNSRDDKKVNLAEYVNSELELNPPQEVGLSVHWLAVDGLQPNIQQNPVLDQPSSPSTTDTKDEDTNTSTSHGLQVTQLLPRLLSEELQLYFNRVTTAMQRGSSTPESRLQQDAALASISTESGLQELVPFFVNYVSTSLFQNVGNPLHCRVLVRMARSLFSNSHLHLELHLHQLLPALLTCVVAERLASSPAENHWDLRKDAATVLVQACDLFGDDYATLRARILKTLCGAVSPNKCLPTQYGGIVGISLFGARAIGAFLLPISLKYWKAWERSLTETKNLNQRMEIQMCQNAVLDALGIFVSQGNPEAFQSLDINWEELMETFGDRLVMMSGNPTDSYVCCVV